MVFSLTRSSPISDPNRDYSPHGQPFQTGVGIGSPEWDAILSEVGETRILKNEVRTRGSPPVPRG